MEQKPLTMEEIDALVDEAYRIYREKRLQVSKEFSQKMLALELEYQQRIGEIGTLAVGENTSRVA